MFGHGSRRPQCRQTSTNGVLPTGQTRDSTLQSVAAISYTSIDLPMQTLPRRRDLTTMAVRGSDFSSVIARDESSNKLVFLNESRMCLVVGTACPMRPVTPLKSLKTFKLLSCSLPFYAVFSKDILQCSACASLNRPLEATLQ